MGTTHRSVVLIAACGLLAGLFAAGCSRAPKKEIDRAQATIDSVKAIEDVQLYAADQVAAAEQELASARQLSQEKNYLAARLAAMKADSMARMAPMAAEQGKAQMGAEAEKSITDARTTIGDAQAKLTRAGRKAGAGATALKGMLDEATSDVSAAVEAQGRGASKEANDKAQAAIQKAQMVSAKVDSLTMPGRPAAR